MLSHDRERSALHPVGEEKLVGFTYLFSLFFSKKSPRPSSLARALHLLIIGRSNFLSGDISMNKKLPFILQYDNKENYITAHAGLPLVCELWNALDMDRKIKRIFDAQSKGFSHAEILKTLVCLVTMGGDCVDDVNILAEDKAFLKLTLIHAIPSPSTIRRYLKRCHQDYTPIVGSSFVPDENDALIDLGSLP